MNAPDSSRPSPLLHAYAVCVALGIVVLICSGGMVTSKGAGLAVPGLAEQLRLQHVRVPDLALGRRRVL